MSRVALLESLRRQAAEDGEAIWRDARDSAEKYRLEMEKVLEQQRAQNLQVAAAAAQRLEAEATAQARHRAREIRTNAAIALAERLHRLALAELPRLRSAGAGTLFVALAGELPRREWQRVRVNPSEKGLAREQFPRAEVVGDEAIAGGMEVQAEEGRIRVSNTLETRLATAWPDMLPGLMATLLTEPRDQQSAA